MSKLGFFQSRSHIGWDLGFSSKIGRIPRRLGWLDSQQANRATTSCINTDTHLNQTLYFNPGCKHAVTSKVKVTPYRRMILAGSVQLKLRWYYRRQNTMNVHVCETKMVSNLRFYLESKCTGTPILLWAPHDLLGCLSCESQIIKWLNITCLDNDSIMVIKRLCMLIRFLSLDLKPLSL